MQPTPAFPRSFPRMPHWLRAARRALVLMAGMLAVLSGAALAQTVAVTFDDGLDPRGEPRAAQWNAHLLDTLARHRVRAMFFPAGVVVDSPDGLALVRAWGQAGHAIGNHTYSHQALGPAMEVDAFWQDVEREQALLSSMPGWCPRLRFPYLNEGETPERNAHMMAVLAEHGYGVAAVTIAIDDWNYNMRFLQQADANPGLDISSYRKAYLDRLWKQASEQEAEWKKRLGRSPPHVLLLHTNALNTILLGDILDMFKQHGWTFVDPAAAFADPIYQRGFVRNGQQGMLPVPACR